MTNKEFEEICLKEFPLIEGMGKTVKALNVGCIPCSVYADGSIDFCISESASKAFHTAFHGGNCNWKPGEIMPIHYDENGEAFYAPYIHYDVPATDDGVLDDIPETATKSRP